ncbi:MAG: N-acetyl-gamma-glutamyl-phosphate reductase [Candidatus Binatia bacterium]|nr:N-acetyl-gamma-glutamyl-phosphate reductase [Candidatus Binatia bacterium]
MSRPRIFIDGHVGTTGLRIRDWLAPRDDLELLQIEESKRKDPDARRELLNRADLVILCLPDAAAREAVTLIENDTTRVVDASTAHRVADGWVYGLPEISAEHRASLAASRRISNPGCWPTSPILSLRPLVDEGIVPADAAISIHGLSGYSGGGRSMVEKWEDPANRLVGLSHEAPYAMERRHKHAPELLKYSHLSAPPHFLPSVGPFRCGMRVGTSLHAASLAPGADGKRIHEVLADCYASSKFVNVCAYREPLESDEFTFDPQACNDTNRVDLHVATHPDGHVLLVGVLDNLGKGAAGAAVQNLNLMLGLDEGAGLTA